MKLGARKPSISRSVKARTTGRVTRAVKKSVNPTYGKKGMGVLNDPKRAAYNAAYKRTTFSARPSSKGDDTDGFIKNEYIQAERTGTRAAYIIIAIILLMAGLVIFFIARFLFKNTNPEEIAKLDAERASQRIESIAASASEAEAEQIRLDNYFAVPEEYRAATADLYLTVLNGYEKAKKLSLAEKLEIYESIKHIPDELNEMGLDRHSTRTKVVVSAVLLEKPSDATEEFVDEMRKTLIQLMEP